MNRFLDWVEPGGPEAGLAARIDSERIPRHIAVIMDGNGRWARKRFLPRAAGHRAGAESVRLIIEACGRLGVEALTLYAFSVENWKRPKAEVDTLWSLLRRYLHDEVGQLQANNVCVRVLGRREELPTEVRSDLDRTIARTSANTGLTLNVALNYGGRAEIVDAVNALVARARVEGPDFQVDEKMLESQLYTAGLPDPDLLIRTSGEVRVSNFLLWQIAYTEIWVTERLWPDFRPVDLLEAILDYQSRERRFGGLTEDEAAATDEPALVGAALSPPADEFIE